MTVYSYAQLEQLWINAGGPAAQAPVAAAIAEAESGGNSAAVNPADNGGAQTSWGLWQISNGTHAQPSANILDPAANAAAAVAKYQAAGGSFARDWGTYASGAYLPFVSNSTPPSSTGVPAPAAASTTAAVTVVPGTCVIPYPTLNLVITTVGGGCVLSKSQARAVIGGLALAAGGLIALPGLILLAATAFRAVPGASQAASTVAGVARFLP